MYEAKSEEASEKKACMKPTRHGASEKERALGAVYKRTQAGGKKKDEARGEEATEMRDSQACILSGGVYLRHRPEKRAFLKNLLAQLFPLGYYNMRTERRARLAYRRAGVQETEQVSKLSPLPTDNEHFHEVYLIMVFSLAYRVKSIL